MIAPKITSERAAAWFEGLALGLLVLTFFFTPLTTLRLAGVAIGDFFVMGLICLVPVSILVWGLPRKTVPRWMLVAAALFAGSLVLTLIFPFEYDRSLYERLTRTGDPYSSSVVIWVRLVFAVLVFPMVVALLVRDWSRFKWLAGAWVAGVSLSCLVALIDAGLGTQLQEKVAYDAFEVRGFMGVWADVTEYQRFVGLTDHPNTLGITAVMASPIIIFWMTGWGRVLLAGPVLMLLVVGVFLSGSRAALVGLLAAAAAVLFFYRRPVTARLKGFFAGRRGKFRLAGVLAVLLIGLAAAVAIAASQDRVGTIGDSVTLERIFDPDSDTAKLSNEERTQSLEAGLDAVAARPVTGTSYVWIETPHNIVLGLLMSGGVLALLAFGWAMVGYLRTGVGLRQEVPAAIERVVVASLASLIAYIVMSPLINQSFNRFLYLPAALLMAAWVLSLRQEEAG